MQLGFWNWEIANQHVGVNVSILKCAYSEITADYEVHIYVCDVMYQKLYILFSLASQKDHIIFFQVFHGMRSSFVANKHIWP